MIGHSLWPNQDRRLLLPLFLFLLLVEVHSGEAQPGSLDSTFGVNGVTAPIYEHEDNIVPTRESFLVRMQGKKLVVVGQDYRFAHDFAFPLRRFQSDGTLDSSFGLGGTIRMTNDSLGWIQTAQAMVVLQDERILTAGLIAVPYRAYPLRRDIALVRYQPDGTIDTSFGEKGIASIDIGNVSKEVYNLSVGKDQKIIVLWRDYEEEDNYNIGLLRFYPNGMLDSTFGTNGVVLTDIGGSNDVGYSLLLQKDGKILVAGCSETMFGYTDPLILRYNIDGSIDRTFGSGGIVFPSIEFDQTLYSTLLQPDGKIVAAGRTFNGSDYDLLLLRYNSDGSLDHNFGSEGLVATDFGNTNITNNYKRGPSSGAYDVVQAIALQQDGRIVVAGYTRSVDNTDLALLRYNADGSLDKGFGRDGKVTDGPKIRRYVSNDHMHIAYDLLVQPDGKIVIAGSRNRGGGLFVARYRADGSSFTQQNGEIIARRDEREQIVLKDLPNSETREGDGIPNSSVGEPSGAVAGELYRGFIADMQVTFSPIVESRVVVVYQLLQDEELTIELYDPYGRSVQVLLPPTEHLAGSYREEFDLVEPIRTEGYIVELRGKDEIVQMARVPEPRE